MALFKKTAKKEETKAEASPAKDSSPAISFAQSVLVSPRITEKAAIGNDVGIYVFNVTQVATKSSVSAAVKELFKVVPRKVTVVSMKAKSTLTRATGRRGKTNTGKKAYVYLKKGDKIDLA